MFKSLAIEVKYWHTESFLFYDHPQFDQLVVPPTPSPNQHQGSKTWSRSQILRCRMIFTCFDNLSNRMQPCLVWPRQCNISMWKRSPLWYTHIGLCHPNKSFMMLKPAHRWNSTPWYPATTCNWLLIIQIFDHIFLSLLSLFWGNDLTLAQGIHSLI